MAGAGIAGGSLIGVLGGLVGMLLGWSAGAASGALYDADRLDTGDEAIEQFGALVPTGGNALLAETVEDTSQALDTVRRPERFDPMAHASGRGGATSPGRQAGAP
jgi:uncharacterized membrane protein